MSKSIVWIGAYCSLASFMVISRIAYDRLISCYNVSQSYDSLMSTYASGIDTQTNSTRVQHYLPSMIC